MNNVLFAMVVLLPFVSISMQVPCQKYTYTHRGQLHNPGIASHPNFQVMCSLHVSVCSGGCHTEHQYKVQKYNGASDNATSYCHISVKCCSAQASLRPTWLYNCRPYSGYTGNPPAHPTAFVVYARQARYCECQYCLQTSSVADCTALHA